MAHPKYGERFTCFSCGTKFYNMNKPEDVCPKCGSNQKKAPKKQTVKLVKPPVAEEPESEDDDTAAEGTQEEFAEGVEEEVAPFNPASDKLIVDELPDGPS